jgi:DNA-binding SARP family transcriptional activator
MRAVVLRVGVLGPVMAWNNDQELPVGQPRQQAVLGILAMRANRVISRGELVDAVWGQDPPPSAEGGVYTYVAGLRRAFEPGRSLRGPGRILVSSGAGYVLHLVPGQPDAVAFEQDLLRARQQRKAADPSGAVASFDKALGLWRGVVAFAGVPGPFAETERARLTELRSAAGEERADAMLALGRHEEVLADLTAMVAEHPLREGMRALLMLALYRSGRQAEALRVFADGREVLAEELGIDPGAELSRIHQQVLTSDPDLALGGEQARAGPASIAAGGQPGAHPVPAQLPAEAAGFSGRHDELAVLHKLVGLQEAVQVVVVSGMAGVGKTALAIRFGRQVAKRFPDGQLYLNLRGFDPALQALDPGEALRFLLDALGVASHRVPGDTESRAALYRSVADGKRLLIVLDNAVSAAQVRPLLPGSPGALVVVTSRNELSGLIAVDGAVPVSLDVLSLGEARELLDRRLGHDRARSDPKAADEIIAACARLPLALSIAVGRAARPRRSLSEVAAELTQTRDGLGGLDALETGDEAADVRTVFSWSYYQLGEQAARMFRLLGVHPGPDISLPAAASLAGLPRPDAAAALRELARTHMAAEHAPGRFTFHELLRAYAADQAERSDTGTERRAAAHRVLDHYLHTSMAAAARFSPYRAPLPLGPPSAGVAPGELTDKDQAVTWFLAEAPVLLTLIRFAYAEGFDAHAWQLSWALALFFVRRGRWQDLLASQQIAVAAAMRLGDTRALSQAHYYLGYAYALLGDYEACEPQVRQALAECREIGDRAHEAHVLNGLADILQEQGRLDESLELLLDGLRMVKAVGHWWAQGTLEMNAGEAYTRLGKYDVALTHCQRALGLHREAGNPSGAAIALRIMGQIHGKLGSYDQARTCFEQAVAGHRDLEEPLSEAVTLDEFGDTLTAAGDAGAATAAWQSALAIFEGLENARADHIRAKLGAGPPESQHAAQAVTTGR